MINTKHDLGSVFRDRLNELVRCFPGDQAEFARSIGMDRSAISQLLSNRSGRLPRAETLFALARRHSISLDWLMGLKSDDQSVEIKSTLEFADTTLAQWQREAIDHKIRHVPCRIPAALSTEAVIAYQKPRTPGANCMLGSIWRPESDIEICMAMEQLVLLAEGRGIWSALGREARRIQIDRMAGLLEEMYPRVRLFLYSAMHRFSIPYTLFGPQRAAICGGEMVFVLNLPEHTRAFSTHFDNLIRQSVFNAGESTEFLRTLTAI